MHFKPARKIRSFAKWTALAVVGAFMFAGCEIKVEPPETKPPVAIQVPPAQAALVGLGAKLEKQKFEASASPVVENGHKSVADGNSGGLSHAESKPRLHKDELLLTANDQPNPDQPKTDQPKTDQPKADQPKTDQRKAEQPKADRPANNAGGKFDVPQAVDQIALEIRDAIDLRKTLVVLLVEQTPRSAALVGQVADRFTRLAHELEASQHGLFEIAILGYSDGVNWIMPDPTGDAAQIEVGLSTVKETKGEKANVLAAVNETMKKFLLLRLHGYEVIFVVAGNSSGDDLNLADGAIKSLRKAAVPMYGIGPAILFGSPRLKPGAGRRAVGAGDSGERPVESLYPERIQLALSGNQNTADLNDSGYGPFGLERLCRETEGKFFRLHTPRPQGWAIDPSEADIKPELMAKYAPDYVDEAQYQRVLEENKCRMALHNASLLPPAEGLGQVTTEFPKQKDEAALAKMITNAQKAAAIDDQPLQRLYDTLTVGEGDRPKLTGARWQAGYDLAMGQVLAAKARLDGYNAILAIIKQGKAFANEDSTKWVLEPANENAAGSVLDKMTKKSRTYLQRVVDEHPGTPWASVAERELKYPAGWKLVEK